MANSGAHVKDGFDSAYVTALALKKAYELNSAILERLLWECEGMLHATDIGLSRPFHSNDDFFARASLKGIVLNHLNSKQTFFYREKERILKKAKDKTGIDYNDMPTVDGYTAYVLDTCMVKLSCAVLWLHKRKIPLLREAQGVIRSDIDAIIATHTGPPKASSKPSKQKNEVTGEEAAKLAGVTTRTIQNWEKGVGRPKGYPGLVSRSAFISFIERRKHDRRAREAARNINRAVSGGDMNEYSESADLS